MPYNHSKNAHNLKSNKLPVAQSEAKVKYKDTHMYVCD